MDDESTEKSVTDERKKDDHDLSEETVDLSSQDLNGLTVEQLPDKGNTITVLNLDYNSLSQLPASFAKSLRNLKVFTANGNNLKTLPVDFGCLTNLIDVQLCENELVSLPNSVQHLCNMKCIRLTGNKLATLPEDFGEIASLEELHVEENELTEFPPTFALLNKLRILEASHNKLCVLPKYLGSMCSLTHLNISSNDIEKIPDSFSELEQLVCVDISSNHLTVLPAGCSSQKTLKKFYAGLNSFTGFTSWLGHLPELTDLCLKENNITGNCLPDDFGKVSKKLRNLNLCGNHLTVLPESFGELESLEFVHFGSMLDELERSEFINGNWLTKLPTSFPQLACLTKLRLDENHIQFLPDDFGSLCSLEVLNMGQNLLHDLPESFGNLCSLRVCLLSRNNLQLLPSTMGQLSALEELHLDNNLLAELPESFGDLKQLKVLDLFHNKLTELPGFLKHFTKLQFLDLKQNPMRVLKRLVPAIQKHIEYKPRTKEPSSTWRGRMRVGTEIVNDLVVVEMKSNGEKEDDEYADEPVDEIYGSEDLPYNLRFANSPDLNNLMSWRKHGESEIRPMFHRPWQRSKHVDDLEESEYDRTSSSCAEGSQTEEEQSVASQDEGAMEELWDLPDQEDKWNNGEGANTAVEEENWDYPPLPSYQPLQTEESWEDELGLSSGGSDCGLQRKKSSFTYNPELVGFFWIPSDLHEPAVYRPKLDPDYVEPELEEGQFSDAGDS